MANSTISHQSEPLMVVKIALFATVIMLGVVAFQASKTLGVFQNLSILRGAITVAIGGGVSLFLLRLFRSQLVVLAVPLAYCAYNGHTAEVLAWALFCGGSLALGSFLIRLLPTESATSLGEILPFLRLLAGVGANSFLTWAAMHLPINYTGTYWVLYGLELILFALSHGLPKPALNQRWTAGHWLVFLHVLLFLPYAMVPSYNHDDIAAHLFIPKQTALLGQFQFSPEFVSAMNPSMLPMGAYTSVFMLGGETGMRLLNLSMYSFGFLLLESFTRQRWGIRASFLAVLFGVLTPFTHWTLGICFVDSFMFSFSTLLLAVAARFIEVREASLLPVLGLVAALGYLTKQQMIFVILPIAVPILVTALRAGCSRRRDVALNIALASLIFCAIISPPLIHNYLLSGNPLFPFYNSIFKSPYFPPQNFADGRWNQPLSLATLWTITFSGSKFVENGDFSFGFAPLVLFPAILAIGGYRTAKRDLWIPGLLLFSLAYAYVSFVTTGLYMRYLVGLIAPLSLCLALTSNALLSLGRTSSRITALVVACLAAGNFAALLSGDHTAAPYPILESLSGSLERSSMAYDERFKKLFQKGRLLCKRNSLGLLIDSPANYFAQTRLVSNSWLFPMVSSKLASAASTEDLRSFVFDQLKACYVIMPLSPSPTGVGSSEFRKLLRPVGKTADFGLYVPLQ